MEERTYGVAELAGTLARVLGQVFPAPIWIRGQIRNLSRSAAGHVYFDLAEPGSLGSPPDALVPVTLLASDRAAVNAVMRAAGAGRISDGVEVRIAGRLQWYAPRGRAQLRMSAIDPEYTLGRLAADRDRLLATLRAEQLLDRNRSRPLPDLPTRLGLVTSVGSAAHADFLHELESSGLGFTVIVADARTQGADAGRSIALALQRVYSAGVEVACLVRGGGSRTDLAPFDGEAIARAIASAPVPVLTGIGHEIDRSIADEVAHTAFKTPTACASALVDLVRAAIGRLDAHWRAIAVMAVTRADSAAGNLDRLAGRVGRAAGARLSVAERTNRLAVERLAREAPRAIASAERRLDGLDARVRALDPARVLARGWSITRDASGATVRSPDDVAPGDLLVTTLIGGTVTSHVTDPPAEPGDPRG